MNRFPAHDHNLHKSERFVHEGYKVAARDLESILELSYDIFSGPEPRLPSSGRTGTYQSACAAVRFGASYSPVRGREPSPRAK